MPTMRFDFFELQFAGKSKPKAKTMGTESQSVRVQTTGGFRIETHPDEIIVTKAVSAEDATATKRWLRYCAYGALLSCALFALLISARRYPLFLTILLAIAVLQYLFGGVHNLRCTRESLDVVDIVHGRIRRTRSFPQSEVKRVRFAAVSYSKYGAITGLVFTAAGKNIKTLYGLKCVEAQQILYEIQRLGYDVEHDVAMPMMVEMEQSRCKSWFCN
jgi:hypothetical protein